MTDRGFKLGDVVFDTSRTFNGSVFRLRDHLARFYRSLQYTRIDPGMTIDPSDGTLFWVFNEYALTRGAELSAFPGQDGRWGTRWGSFLLSDALPGGAGPAVASLPTGAPAGETGVDNTPSNFPFPVTHPLPTLPEKARPSFPPNIRPSNR